MADPNIFVGYPGVVLLEGGLNRGYLVDVGERCQDLVLVAFVVAEGRGVEDTDVEAWRDAWRSRKVGGVM